MPQLVPFYFLNQVSYGFLLIFITIFVLSKYLLPLTLRLQFARTVLSKLGNTVSPLLPLSLMKKYIIMTIRKFIKISSPWVITLQARAARAARASRPFDLYI